MKNSKVIKRVLAAAGIVTGLTAIASAIGTKTIMERTEKKCESIQGKNTYSCIFVLGKNEMIVKEDLDILFPSTILGKNVVDFTKKPLKKAVFVDYTAVLGKIVLRVPNDVKVISEEYDPGVWENTVEAQGDIGDENDVPTIYVKGTKLGGSLKIVRS